MLQGWKSFENWKTKLIILHRSYRWIWILEARESRQRLLISKVEKSRLCGSVRSVWIDTEGGLFDCAEL